MPPSPPGPPEARLRKKIRDLIAKADEARTVTAMLLNLDPVEILNMIEQPDFLHEKVVEALTIIRRDPAFVPEDADDNDNATATTTARERAYDNSTFQPSTASQIDPDSVGPTIDTTSAAPTQTSQASLHSQVDPDSVGPTLRTPASPSPSQGKRERAPTPPAVPGEMLIAQIPLLQPPANGEEQQVRHPRGNRADGRGGGRGGRGSGRGGAAIDIADVDVFPQLPNMQPAIFSAMASQQHPQQQQPQRPQHAYADAAARAELDQIQLREVPPHVAAAVGLGHANMPLLPKRFAHRYDIESYVTMCKYDCEDLATLHASEEYWRRSAMDRAARVVVVRVPGSRPWMFFHGIQADPSPIPLEMRTTVIALERRRLTLDADLGLAPAGELHVLQGTEADLAAYATCVEVRFMIGKDGDTKYFEATGVPRPGTEWQSKLLGAPMRLICATEHAGLRATVKAPFQKTPFIERYNKICAMQRRLRPHIAFVVASGFDSRVFSASPFTTELKKRIMADEAVRSVYTDLKTLPTPPRVGATAAVADVQLAAADVGFGELAIFAHSAVPYEPTMWERLLTITQFAGARLLLAAATVAVFALPGARAAAVDGVDVNDTIYLSRVFTG
jgi:hypothetical protein